MSTDIKRFSDRFRQIKESVTKRMEDASSKLDRAHERFLKAADDSESFIAAIDDYSNELHALTSELTNGGPPLDTTFPAAAPPAPGVSPVEAMIETQEQLGRRHPSNQ